MEASEVEITERLSVRRALACIVLALVFVAAQAASFSPSESAHPTELFEAAWTLWAATLVLTLVLASGLVRGPGVRQMLSDETTIDNRRKSLVAGFWGSVLTSGVVFAVDMGERLSGGEAARLIVTFAVATALFRFGQLERRSLRRD